jgi:hypothetical protein
MSHFFEGCSDGTCFLAVVEEGTEFGFGGAGHNLAHDGVRTQKDRKFRVRLQHCLNSRAGLSFG